MIRKLALVVAVGLIAAACGSGATSGTSSTTLASTTTNPSSTTTTTAAPPTTTAPDDGFPATIDTSSGPVTIESKPSRIVSISPTSTEVLFAIGAADQVVAVDSLSDFPEGTPITELSAFNPSVEAIAAFEPDLVFLSFDPGDIIAGLEALGIPAVLHSAPSDLEGAYRQWEQTGVATGHVAEAALLVAEVETSIALAANSLPSEAEFLTYYYELDQSLYSATSSTFIGDVLSVTSMRNIADEADEDGYGYPQLSSEYVISSDPDLILLADAKCCGQTSETVGDRSGWGAMRAVTRDQIVLLDDDIASRWGPRVADLVQQVVDAILLFERVGS